MRPTARSDSAVSNTLGFVMITGILLTSVALVFMIGLPVYDSYVYQSHMQNMLEAFDLISENGNNVALLKTPYQQSEVKLYDGTIAPRDAGTMTVEFFSGGSRVDPSETLSLSLIEYSKNDGLIAYLLGGVFRKDDYSYPVIKQPPMYYYTTQDGTRILYMPLISLYHTDGSLSGTTLARISFSTLYYSKKIQVVGQPVLHTYHNVDHVQITLQNCDYSQSLAEYFQDLGFTQASATSDTLVLTQDFNPTITVNTIQSTVIVTVNSGTL